MNPKKAEIRAFYKTTQRVRLKELEKAPQKFIGMPVSISGDIVQIWEYESVTKFTLKATVGGYPAYFLVRYPGVISSVAYDSVTVYGWLAGEDTSLINEYGQPIVYLAINAKYVRNCLSVWSKN